MNGDFKHIINKLLPGMLLVLTAVMVSCAEDADEGDRHGSTATLQMQVSTRAEGDQAGESGTEPGDENENIHSICVLLVNSQGKVAWKYINDNLSDDASATEYLSEPIQDLPLGAYDVYAFANFDYYTNGAGGAAGLWTTLKNLDEGAPFVERILSLVVDDPASRMDFTQQRYIPMSGKEENFVVSSNTSIIPVTLDRLVSKVQISVSVENAKYVTGLNFSGWADKVALFSGADLGDNVTFNNSKEINKDEMTVDDDGTVVVSPFYVNETPGGHTFNVSVKTNESTAGNPESIYTATTKQSGLPRNSIYPLAITINDWGLDITAKCWVSPIGHYPVPVKATLDPNTYSIDIPEGAQFQFTLGGLDGIDNSTAIWNIIPEDAPGIDFEDYTDGVETVKGHVTATAGNTYVLNVLATWQDTSGNHYQRTYTVKMTTTDIADAVFETDDTRAASPFTRVTEWGGVRNVFPEVLDIHVKR